MYDPKVETLRWKCKPFICLQKKKLFININSGDLFFWDMLLVE